MYCYNQFKIIFKRGDQNNKHNTQLIISFLERTNFNPFMLYKKS